MVWIPRPDGSLVPIHLPPPCDADVVAIATDIAKRSLAVVEKYGDAEADATDDATADTAQRMLADVVKRHRDESPRNDKPRRLSAFVERFSLECAPSAEASDRSGLARLLRYGLRPPFAHDRIEQLPNGNISYRLRRLFHTGQTHVVMSATDFVRRIAALIPPPACIWFATTDCSLRTRLFALPHVRWFPEPTTTPTISTTRATTVASHPRSRRPMSMSAPRRRPRPMRRIANAAGPPGPSCSERFSPSTCCAVPVAAPGASPLPSRATPHDALERFLRHIGEPTVPLPILPARGPPQTDFDWHSDAAQAADPMPDYDR